MPSKNVVKIYVENGYYHIYNRGFEKRNIFLDKNDYAVFTGLIRRCLDQELKLNSYGLINTHSVADEASLLCYCLMPNHFHLLIKQNTKDAVTKFLRRLLTSYVRYFNKKHEREGTLFQGKPRGVLIKNDSQLLHLSRYIHLNPFKIMGDKALVNYSYSSYPTYLNQKGRSWINTSEILGFFKSAQRDFLGDILSYQSFVENYKKDPKELLGSLTLD